MSERDRITQKILFSSWSRHTHSHNNTHKYHCKHHSWHCHPNPKYKKPIIRCANKAHLRGLPLQFLFFYNQRPTSRRSHIMGFAGCRFFCSLCWRILSTQFMSYLLFDMKKRRKNDESFVWNAHRILTKAQWCTWTSLIFFFLSLFLCHIFFLSFLFWFFFSPFSVLLPLSLFYSYIFVQLSPYLWFCNLWFCHLKCSSHFIFDCIWEHCGCTWSR